MRLFKVIKFTSVAVVFPAVVFSLSMSNLLSAAPINLSTTAKTLGVKKIVKPEKIILVKISPRIPSDQKFIQAMDVLFVDQLKLNQNLFSYVAVNDKVYKLRDFDFSYSANDNDNKIVYIGYTNSLPLQLISDLAFNFNIQNIKLGKIDFKKNEFNINENQDKVPSLPAPANNIKIGEIIPYYNAKPDPGVIQTVTVKFKNNFDYPLFKSDPSRIIAIAQTDGKEKNSTLFVNTNWYSRSRAGSIVDERVGFNEMGSLQFQVIPDVVPGTQVQKFTLAASSGELIPGSEFELKFEIPDQGQKLVEVKNSYLNFVNFQEQPDSKSKTVGIGDAGRSYIFIEEKGSWTKVKFDGGKEGWTPTSGLKKVN